MKLYVTMHGVTEGNKEKRFHGCRTDSELSSEGYEQIRRLGERLKNENVSAIYSSPLKRNQSSASCLQEYLRCNDFFVIDFLKEIDYGIFEGLTREESYEKYPEKWIMRESDKFNYEVPNGESYRDGYLRAGRVLRIVLGKGLDSIIVGHGSIDRCLFMWLTGKGLDELKNPENASLSLFEIYEKEIVCRYLNCVNHLI